MRSAQGPSYNEFCYRKPLAGDINVRKDFDSDLSGQSAMVGHATAMDGGSVGNAGAFFDRTLHRSDSNRLGCQLKGIQKFQGLFAIITAHALHRTQTNTHLRAFGLAKNPA